MTGSEAAAPAAPSAEPAGSNGLIGTGLSRSLEARHVSMIAIGGIIGAGLFVGSSTTIAAVGPAAAVAYGLGGLIILAVMRMLSEMAIALDGVQGFPDFARAGLGHWAGFVSGWLYWYFWVVVIAIEAIAGAKIIGAWAPSVPVWAIGVVLMAVLTGVNLLSARSYGEFEYWFSAAKVAAIGLFILAAAGFAMGLGGAPTWGNLVQHGGFAPAGWGAVLAAVASTIFALCGAEIATIAAAESAEPDRVIARMTVSVTVRILVFYVASILLITAVIPWTSIRPGLSPFATALAGMAVPGGATIMNAVVLVAVLSCLNSGLFVTSRALFGLARHGDAPAWLVVVNGRQVPARAILVGSLFSYAALAAERAAPDTVFSFLLNSSGVTMIILYLLLATAQLRLRARLEREAPHRLRLRMWWHPWGSLAAIAAMAGVLLFMALDPVLASQLWLSLAVMGGALLLFALRRQFGR